jgi:hypothetical protein
LPTSSTPCAPAGADRGWPRGPTRIGVGLDNCGEDGGRLKTSTTLSQRSTGNELARIKEAVSPDLEICAVTDRVSKTSGGGPALLFERPTGFDIPVAINLFGSMKRICMALGVKSLDDLVHGSRISRRRKFLGA